MLKLIYAYALKQEQHKIMTVLWSHDHNSTNQHKTFTVLWSHDHNLTNQHKTLSFYHQLSKLHYKLQISFLQ